jgi:hypothetical protein
MDLEEHAQRFRSSSATATATFSGAFDAMFAAADIQVLKIPPRAPRANSFAER